jgi:hypothetical protein
MCPDHVRLTNSYHASADAARDRRPRGEVLYIQCPLFSGPLKAPCYGACTRRSRAHTSPLQTSSAIGRGTVLVKALAVEPDEELKRLAGLVQGEG